VKGLNEGKGKKQKDVTLRKGGGGAGTLRVSRGREEAKQRKKGKKNIDLCMARVGKDHRGKSKPSGVRRVNREKKRIKKDGKIPQLLANLPG